MRLARSLIDTVLVTRLEFRDSTRLTVAKLRPGRSEAVSRRTGDHTWLC